MAEKVFIFDTTLRDGEQVRAIVREPMKGYLRSSLDLVKQAAWSFPAFKNRVDKPGELDAVMAEITAWQGRPLEPMYPVVFFDALRVKIREDAVVRN